MNASLSIPALQTTVRCSVAAAAALRASADEIKLWRRQTLVVGQDTLSISLLKHAEDQTVLAVRTVVAALDRHGWHARRFADWGVIAAGSFFGRPNIAQAILRYADEGTWGVSPHLVPQQSLHAMSGTISQALQIHGPNFGIGGGPNAAPDALLLAAAMLYDGTLPGLWVVLTGHETEWIPAVNEGSNPAPICQAAALALTPATAPQTGPILTIGQADREGPSGDWPELHVGLLAEELMLHPEMPSGRWRLSASLWAELETAFLPAEDGR